MQAPSDVTRTAATPLVLQGTLFAFAWALALVFDRLVRTSTLYWQSAVFMLAALVALVWPRLPSLMALAIVHLGWVAWTFERSLHVHWYLAGTVDLAILGACVYALVRDGRAATLGSFAQAFSGVGRVLAILSLFFVGFAKLNTSFTDVNHSCAAELYEFQRLAFPFSLLPSATWAKQTAVWLAVAAELGTAVLLLIPRLRVFAVLFACGFFTLIGVNPQAKLYEFSSLFLAMLTLFVPPDALSRARDFLWSNAKTRAVLERAARIGRSPLSSVPGLLLVAYLTYFADRDALASDERDTLCRIVYVVLLFAFIALLSATLRWRTPSGPFWSGPPLLLIVPLVFALHESTVYAGFKHMPSLTMAANLKVERGLSNHFLIREPPHFESNRTARLIRASDSKLYANGNTGILSSALEDYIARNPDSKITYELDGKIHKIRSREDAERVGKRSFWFALLTRGRPNRRIGTYPAIFQLDDGEKGCHHSVKKHQRERRKLDETLRAMREERYGF